VLQVIVPSDADGGLYYSLVRDDVSNSGDAAGESGDSASGAVAGYRDVAGDSGSDGVAIDSADTEVPSTVLQVIVPSDADDGHSSLVRDDVHDYNRDRPVSATDVIIAPDNRISPSTALQLIVAPTMSGFGMGPGIQTGPVPADGVDLQVGPVEQDAITPAAVAGEKGLAPSFPRAGLAVSTAPIPPAVGRTRAAFSEEDLAPPPGPRGLDVRWPAAGLEGPVASGEVPRPVPTSDGGVASADEVASASRGPADEAAAIDLPVSLTANPGLDVLAELRSLNLRRR